MRAAQAFFELPSKAPAPTAAPVVASRSKASTRALGNVLERKTISAYLDAETQLMRILYKQIVLRFKPGTPQKLRNAIIRDSGLRLFAENALAPGQVTLSDDDKLHPGEALVRLAAQLATLDEVAFLSLIHI